MSYLDGPDFGPYYPSGPVIYITTITTTTKSGSDDGKYGSNAPSKTQTSKPPTANPKTGPAMGKYDAQLQALITSGMI